jgi:hypothetical protein
MHPPYFDINNEVISDDISNFYTLSHLSNGWQELDLEVERLIKLIPVRSLKDPCRKQALRAMFLDLVRSFLGERHVS